MPKSEVKNSGLRVTHRKGDSGHSFCGLRIPVGSGTLDDLRVTCPKCLELLDKLKTENLNRRGR
jgi:hypothetical protein